MKASGCGLYRVTMMLVTYKGRVLAAVGATRFYLAPELADRPADDRERQLVSWLCESALGRGGTPDP